MLYSDIGSLFANLFLEAQAKDPKLPTIATVKKNELTKHGKKSKEFQVIQSLTTEDLSDIAIYVGIALSKNKSKPYWTIDEIRNVIEASGFIDTEFIPYLQTKVSSEEAEDLSNMSTEKKKKIALNIYNNILGNINNTIRIVENYNSSKSTWVHELTDGEIKSIFNAIKQFLVLEEKLVVHDTDRALKYELLNHNPDKSLNTTGTWLNDVLLTCDKEVVAIIQDIKDMQVSPAEKTSVELGLTTLNNFKNIFNKYTKLSNKLLWPEADFTINSIGTLKKYFEDVIAYRSEAKKIMDKYRGRK